jgi:hypothetical protein
MVGMIVGLFLFDRYLSSCLLKPIKKDNEQDDDEYEIDSLENAAKFFKLKT